MGCLRKFFKIVFLVFGIAAVGYCQPNAMVKKLHTDLLTGYNKAVLPSADYSMSHNISVVFNLVSFNSINEVDETITFLASVIMNWTDANLSWNSSHYGNITSLVIDSEDIWRPLVYLVNTANEFDPVGKDKNVYAMISDKGEVGYSVGAVLSAKCPTDLSKFPFDIQSCTLTFLSFNTISRFLTFSVSHDKIRLIYYKPHSDWTLLDHYVTSGGGNGTSMFNVTLKLKREPLYYIVVVILPILLFSVINPLVFVLPIDSGERISLSMTILLSYTIFLTMIEASVPKSSNPMCALQIVMIAIIILSGGIVTGTILSVRTYYQEEMKNKGALMNLTTKLKKRKNNTVSCIDSNENTPVTPKVASKTLDNVFFYGSYLCLGIVFLIYFIISLS